MARLRTASKIKKRKTEKKIASKGADLSSSKKQIIRKIVAIGDLHGDYYKLIRHLVENNLIIRAEKDSLKWNKEALNIDLVLLGDYVDWRGEDMEGESSSWVLGSKKILVFLKDTYEQLENLRGKFKNFQSHIHLILGNHDDMMLKALSIFDILNPQDVEYFEKDFFNMGDLSRFMREKNLDPRKHLSVILNFVNWFSQGGRQTVESFGSLLDWKNHMEGPLGEFIKKELKLAVKLDNVLFSHSISDEKEHWKPADILNKEIKELPEQEAEEIRKAYLWGRKLWGYDYRSGFNTLAFTQEDIEEMVKKFEVEKIVIGHTPLNAETVKEYFNGRIINLDFHGIPDSPVFLKEYEYKL